MKSRLTHTFSLTQYSAMFGHRSNLNLNLRSAEGITRHKYLHGRFRDNSMHQQISVSNRGKMKLPQPTSNASWVLASWYTVRSFASLNIKRSAVEKKSRRAFTLKKNSCRQFALKEIHPLKNLYPPPSHDF